MSGAVPQVRLIPAEPLEDQSPRGLLRAFPGIVRELLDATAAKLGDPERDWQVVDARFGLVSQQRTLDEIAQGLLGGMTRERVRQIQVKALARLRRVIESGYAGRGFQVRLSVSSLFEDVMACGPVAARTVVAEPNFVHCLGLDAKSVGQLRSRLEMLLELRGVIRVAGKPPRIPAIWYAGGKKQADEFMQLMADVDWLLTMYTADPVSELDVVMELNKSRTGRRIATADIRSVLTVLDTVERLEDGRIQGRFEYLTGRGNQAYRLITTAGTPLDAEAMAREINRRSRAGRTTNRTNLANQMASDPRLIPIGKSGAWGVKGLHDEAAAPILTLMQEYLERRGEPATAEEILAAVAAIRPVATASVGAYLSSGDSFVRLPNGSWALADWSEAKAAPRKPRQRPVRRKPTLADEVAREAAALLSGAPNHQKKLSELIEYLVQSLGRPRASLYQYVDRLDIAEKVRVGQQVHVRLAGPTARPSGELTTAEVRALIAGGESAVVEFKTSLRWDVRQATDNKALQKMCTKSVAAFLNGQGGHLLIGVADDGGLFGIGRDIRSITKPGQDGMDRFQQSLATAIREHLGGGVAALVTQQIVALDDQMVCVVAVRPSPQPVYLDDGRSKEFYVRMGTTTQPFGIDEAVEYIAAHWAPPSTG